MGWVRHPLKVPEEGEWVALVSVTAEGTSEIIGYLGAEEVHALREAQADRDEALKLAELSLIGPLAPADEAKRCPNCKGRDTKGWPFGPCTVCGGTGIAPADEAKR